MMPAPSGLSTEAKDVFSTLSAVTPSTVRLTSETFGSLGSLRERLDSRAVGAVLESAYGLGKEPVAPLPLGTAHGRETWLARRDRAASTSYDRETADLVLNDFDYTNLDDALLNAVAVGQVR